MDLHPADPLPYPPTAPQRPAAPVPPPTVGVLGLPIALTDYEATLDWIDASVAAGDRGYVCVAPVHTVMMCREDAEFRAAVLGASLIVPDGQPVVWAMRAFGARDASRVYGPDLMAAAFDRAARTGRKMFLYGGRNEGVLVQLTLNLRRRHPGVQIVGGYSPPFRPLTPDEEARVIAEIDASGAEIVWAGIGVPKQEKWMAAMRDRLQAPVLIGVGAAFDFHAGLVPQAPERLQRLGLEWAFRLAQEPRRLWRRYLRYNPRFVLGFARQYGRQRRGR